MVYELQREISNSKESLVKLCEMKDVDGMDNSQLLCELKEQNQRLSRQLAEAAEREAELRIEIKRLKEQYQRERMKMGEYNNYIESLKVEISLTLDKEAELERRICELTYENECLSESLHFSVDKIYALEKRQMDQDYLLRSSERDLEDLFASNHYLTKRLETMMNRRTSKSCKASLMSELENVEGELWHQNW